MTTYSGSVSPSQTWSFTSTPISVNYNDTITISLSGTNVEGLEFGAFYVTTAWLSANTPRTTDDLATNSGIFDTEGNGAPPTTIPSHTVATLSAANGGDGGLPPGFLNPFGQYVTSGSGYLILDVYGYGDLYPITQSFTITTSGGGQSPPPPPSPPSPPSPPPSPPTNETYTGPSGGDFGNPGNWSGGAVPGSITNVSISNSVTSSGNYEVSSLGLNSGTFTVNGGTFQVAGYIINQIGDIIIAIPLAALQAPSLINEQSGSVQVHGGYLRIDPLTNSGTMSVDSGGQILVSGATVNNGTITANSQGLVFLGGQVSSTVSFGSGGSSGPLNINGGVIVLGGADSEPVYFQAGGQLTIDQPTAFSGTIDFAGNPVDDLVDLAGTTITHVLDTGTTLQLTESNGTVLSLAIQNLGFNYVTAEADGSGGTALFFTPGTATDMLMRNSTSGMLEIYDLGGNAIQGAAALGVVGLNWQTVGYGDFSGNPGEADMLMRSSSNGAFEYYDLSNNKITAAGPMGQVGLEWSVAGFGDFSDAANETDMLMRNNRTGAFEVYDIRGNSIVGAGPMGQVGLEWQIAGFGDFSGNANETDMLLRNNNSGVFEVYDVRNNSIVGAAQIGQVGLEWQIAGFGDFSGNANETDMLLRNRTTGAFEVYDINNNRIIAATGMGQVGLEWQIVGFGAFGVNPGESDMLMRSTKTGALEVYDVTSNSITSAAPMGQVGLEWQASGVAIPPANGTGAAAAQLAQSIASFAPVGGALDGASLSDPAIMQSAAASPIAAPIGPLPQTYA